MVRRLGLPFRDVDWTVWDDLLERVHHPAADGHGRAGRQVHRPARRLPVGHRGAARRRVRPPGPGRDPLGAQRRLRRPRPARPRPWPAWTACVIPGGFGVRGIEGKIGADPVRPGATASRRSGLCLGLQCMVIEVARHLAGLDGRQLARVRRRRRRTRSSPRWPTSRTSSPARATWAARCGWAPTRRVLAAGSLVAEAYGATEVSERHRHRYEVNNAYRDALTEAGLLISGTSPDGRAGRVRRAGPRSVHPFFVATQAHPELKSRPTRPHPLFAAFVGAALDYRAADRLPVELHRERPTVGSGTSGAQLEHSARLTTSRAVLRASPRLRRRRLRRHLHRQGHRGAPPTRSACPAAGPPSGRSSSTPAPSRWWRWTTRRPA